MNNLQNLVKAFDIFIKQDYDNLTSLTKSNCKKLSLVTACKDRGDYLKLALASWQKFPFDEIIIVDWSSKVPLSAEDLPDNVKIIQVLDQEYYEHSKARNFKINQAKNDLVLSMDCDVMLMPKFASNFFVKPGTLIMGDNKLASTIGSSIFDKKIYNELGGFNEKFDEGWGFEDLDFYNKVENSKYKFVTYPSSSMLHIDHDDEIRVVNTKNKNKWESNCQNMKLAMDYKDYKNPIFKGRYIVKTPDGKEEEFNNE